MGELTFISPTKGPLSLTETFEEIIQYVETEPEAHYRLIIGTDSQLREETCFVTAIIIHRAGKGARYFYTKEYLSFTKSLRQRIYYETARSLAVASQVAEMLAKNGYADFNLEIHLDVGESGATKDLIREVVGMVVGSGFNACIKPNSFGASTVADRFTK